MNIYMTSARQITNLDNEFKVLETVQIYVFSNLTLNMFIP